MDVQEMFHMFIDILYVQTKNKNKRFSVLRRTFVSRRIDYVPEKVNYFGSRFFYAIFLCTIYAMTETFLQKCNCLI